MKPYALITIALVSLSLQANVSFFSSADLTHWKEKSFADYTKYEFIEEQGETILYANAMGSASGLYYEQKIELDGPAQLSWRWKITQIGQGNNELTKQGDDYPVRLYVIVSGGIKYWKSYSLVYVWSNRAQPEESWDNPYNENVKHIAVESGTDHLGQWRSYERDIKADFVRVFGIEPEAIDAIAVMTDSDNSMQDFEAWYADIRLNKG